MLHLNLCLNSLNEKSEFNNSVTSLELTTAENGLTLTDSDAIPVGKHRVAKYSDSFETNRRTIFFHCLESTSGL